MSSDVIRNITDILLSKADDHDHDHENENDSDADKTATNVAKLVTIIALFIISMGSGMIPMFASKFFNWSEPSRDPRASVLISSLLSFGGGALLCTTFMHLLPEIDENIADLQKDGHLPSWEFSITNLLMAVGFFVIYMVEEIVHVYLRKQQNKSNGHAFVRGHSARESLREARIQRDETGKQVPSALTTVSTAELFSNENNEHRHSHGHNHHHHSHIPSIDGDDLLVSSIRGLLIVLALSVHELFEGLAVGLEQTSSNVWYLFASVAAHKIVIAFCIGVELLVHKTRRWLVILYIFIYAIVSPLGIAIGIWLSNSGDSDGYMVASALLQGLASGTLLYVIFFEILSKHKDGIVQFLAVVVGFFVMFGLKFIGKFKNKLN